MYDRQVRRRRAVLALLVVVSLILLTAYFGESGGGPFHAIQRGVIQVLSPVQEGASRALKPARDLFGWVGDTFHAKKERDQLKSQNEALSKEVIRYEVQIRENRQLAAMSTVATNVLQGYDLRRARIIGRSPNNLIRDTVEVNLGSGDGVRLDQAVVADGGLVGHVTDVASGTSIVTLITDQSSTVSAKILGGPGSGTFGLLKPSVGNPTDLLVQQLPTDATSIKRGDFVVTAGSTTGQNESLYPADIPIGHVSRADPQTIQDSQQVHVSPTVDVRHLSFVEIVTGGPSGSGDRAQVP